MSKISLYKKVRIDSSRGEQWESKHIDLKIFAKWVKRGYPNQTVMDAIKEIRSTTDKKERARIKAAHLPCVSVSCTLKINQSHSAENILQHSGYACIDIDNLETIKQAQEIRDYIINLAYVAFAALSVSAKGVFAIIPLKYPDKHNLHFEQLIKDFASVGITLDTSKRAANAMRFYSYDPDAKWRPADKLLVYDRLPKPKKEVKKLAHYPDRSDSKKVVQYYIDQVVSKRLNIADSYDEWYRLGWALISEVGQHEARQLFHVISSFSSKYKESEVERKFTALLAQQPKNISFGTFASMAQRAGVPKYKSEKPSFSPRKTQVKGRRSFTVDHLGNLMLDGDDIPYSWRFNEQGYKAPTLSEIARAEQTIGRRLNPLVAKEYGINRQAITQKGIQHAV